MFSTGRFVPGCAAVVFLCAVAACAFFVPRNGTGDELGLANPMYMLLRTGHMSYPVYYMFESMVVHPPAHYAEIALFACLGLPLYYAEAMPTALAAMAFALVLYRSRLEPAFKFALFVGGTMTLALAIRRLPMLEWFGMRPEGELLFWWLAGLIALEHARRNGWPPVWSIAGSLFLAYAACLHYYAAPALAGVAVYAVTAARRDGVWHVGSRAVLSVLMPAGLVVAVFTLVFVGPYFTQIRQFVSATAGPPSPIAGVAAHFGVYDLSRASTSLTSHLMSALDSIRLPGAVLFLVLLLSMAPTRILAIAAAPVPLAVLFATAKHAYYLGHEVSLLVTAIVLWLLRAVSWLSEHLSPRASRVAVDVFAVALLLAVIKGSPVFAIAELSIRPRVHEMEHARAAGQAMLGTEAIVGGSVTSWYSSGGAGWYGIDPELLFARVAPVDVRAYAQRFDAIALTPQLSNYTNNERGAGLPSWYADGTLDLRGVYIAESNPMLSYLLLTGRHERLDVFFKKGDLIFRATPSDSGDHSLVTLRCPEEPRERGLLANTVLKLPPLEGHEVLLVAVDTVATMRAFIDHHTECTVRDVQNLSLSSVSARSLRRGIFDEPPIRFFRRIDEIPPRHGAATAATQRSRAVSPETLSR
jgi:hypothetical protein